MTAASEALTRAYKAQQNRRAAAIAAIVAAYYRNRVDVEDPQTIERWVDLMLPRVLSSHDTIGRLAATYASQLRRLEVPTEPRFTFDVVPGAVEEQIRTSLKVVGPYDYTNKMRDIRRLDVDEGQRRALEVEAKEVTARKVAASVIRHAQSGGRATLIGASDQDPVALGYVRVTRAKPCFFCAMLASRGLVFAEDSFDFSDPRFTGDGTAKVHDECGCTMKPVYNRKTDEALAATEPFEDMWSRWGAGGGDALLFFRRGYDHWAKTGVFLDYETVSNTAAFRARND